MKHIIVFFAALLAAASALSQPYPNRPLRMVIPWPPGQATDLVGRVMSEKLSQLLGQPVVPDNRPGAGGMIGTDAAAKSAPDGYTLLAGSSGPVTVNPLLQKTPYDPERDLIPVAKYSFASSGTGATAHLICEYFNSLAGLRATHVPYKGSSPAIADIVGGQVAYTLETVAATMPLVRSAKLKAYGVSLEKGSALAPGIEPLAKSVDLPGFDVGAWLGLMVPTGTPQPVVERLAATMETMMQSADMRERLNNVGLEVDYRRSDDFSRDLKEQRARFADIIHKGNIKLE